MVDIGRMKMEAVIGWKYLQARVTDFDENGKQLIIKRKMQIISMNLPTTTVYFILRKICYKHKKEHGCYSKNNYAAIIEMNGFKTVSKVIAVFIKLKDSKTESIYVVKRYV